MPGTETARTPQDVLHKQQVGDMRRGQVDYYIPYLEGKLRSHLKLQAHSDGQEHVPPSLRQQAVREMEVMGDLYVVCWADLDIHISVARRRQVGIIRDRFVPEPPICLRDDEPEAVIHALKQLTQDLAETFPGLGPRISSVFA